MMNITTMVLLLYIDRLRYLRCLLNYEMPHYLAIELDWGGVSPKLQNGAAGCDECGVTVPKPRTGMSILDRIK